MANETFNSSEFAWKDLEVVLLGRVIGRLLEVKYKTSQEHKEFYGRGNQPLGINSGNKKYAGSIKIGQSELKAMVLKAREIDPTFDPTDFPYVDLNVAYASGGLIERDIVKSIKFTEFEKGMKQGDTEMEIDMPWIALRIQHTV